MLSRVLIGVKYHSITKRCWIDNDLKYTWAGNSYVLVPSNTVDKAVVFDWHWDWCVVIFNAEYVNGLMPKS